MIAVSRSEVSNEQHWIPVSVAFIAGIVYLVASIANSGPGFPLDDGWIHQTYARNLVQSGRWEFVPGEVSAGSTAPLWTLAIAVGYLLRLPHLFWTYLLGLLCLSWLAVAAIRLWSALWPQYSERDWLVGTVLVLSWPFIWAALSGMETLLFLALGSTILAAYVQQEPLRVGPVGLLSGLLVLTRPEGLLLIALLAAALFLRRAYRQLLIYVLVALLPVIPYFAFNITLSGELWPNTFYAKQTEYVSLLEQPLYARYLQLLYFSLGGPAEGWRGMTGAHLLLLPGLLVAAWSALRTDWRRRQLSYTLPLLWAASHVFVYAWRLPVSYQHGRYLWAALPIWILFGLAGWLKLLSAKQWRRPPWRLVKRSAFPVFIVVLLLFVILGAHAYSTDVAFIQNEMVNVAHWLRKNTNQDALIAAHDIGAIGYFTKRPLLDLAGLVSPEVIPLLNDERSLARYVRESGADFLVTAPGWTYSTLVDAEEVTLEYRTNYWWTRQKKQNNMSVYRLP